MSASSVLKTILSHLNLLKFEFAKKNGGQMTAVLKFENGST